jgi:cellulose synthase/poly-beta-1,6-N-acetylglucosamine synthase-like glycosyltransferase
MAIQLICIVFLIPALLVCGYYWFLALYALTHRNKLKYTDITSEDKTHTFAIVIPAHNEETVIAKTIQSCADLEYPANKFTVLVVADNCTDNTAKVAAKMGVTCLERHDENNKGKGYALAWAFEQILPLGYDAVVVLDADCLVDAHALRVFNKNLTQGFKVLQANDVASNPDVNSMGYAVAIGNFIENELFYTPKSALGLAVFLRGTGFVLHREILETLPWRAHSIAEDMEYGISLIKNEIQIRFVPEVKVASEFPVEKDQLDTQRTRWADGNLVFGKKHALKMLWKGIINRQWKLADAGWSFTVLSKPLVLLEIVATIVLSLLCVLLFPGVFSNTLLFFAWFLFILQGIYFALGILLFGVSLRRIVLLFSVPVVVIRLMLISLKSLFRSGKRDWVCTPR